MVSIFIKAFVLTLIILFIGIMLGFWIESSRVEEIRSILIETEILFNDARLQSLYYTDFSNTTEFCESALKSNLEYNSRIYQEGLKIERYEVANKLSPELLLERKRYALLQFQFWMNAVKLKSLCNFDYDVLLHLWKYQVSDYDTDLKNKLESAVILELKEKCGNKLMLSPIPIDLNLTSVDIAVRNYNITKTPAIIINNKIILQGFYTLEQLEGYVNC